MGFRAGHDEGGMVPEVRRAFSEELERLHLDVVRLGALALEAIHRGSEALLTFDLARSTTCVAHDGELDRLSDTSKSASIACSPHRHRSHPTCGHGHDAPRRLTSSSASATTWSTSPRRPAGCSPSRSSPGSSGSSTRCSDQASAQLELALDAFSQRDPSQGSDLPAMDDVMDELTRRAVPHDLRR